MTETVSAALLSTYCSPAFWPQSLSEGSVVSAGPLAGAEEPQTLGRQHPGEQRVQERQNKTEVEHGGKSKAQRGRSPKAEQRQR